MATVYPIGFPRDRQWLVFFPGGDDRRKESTVMNRRPEPVERLKVIGHAVTFMRLKSVAGAPLGQRTHQAIARHFCDDRCRGDRNDDPVAANHRIAVAGGIQPVAAIDEDMPWHFRQALHRALERP
jgi:hypothetical protein